MRKPFLLLLALLFICNDLAIAQANLVPNPSFEDTIGCPTALAQVTTKCSDWYLYTQGTADYFNACNTGDANMPTTGYGYQQALHGNAMCGFSDFWTSAPGYAEYIAVQLSPLTVGSMYQLSFSISLSGKAKYTTNGIGAYFIDAGPSSIPTNPSKVLGISPQVSFLNMTPITDTVNWIRLSKYIIADSAYDVLVIGKVLEDSVMNIDTLPYSGANWSYYFIDSVVLTKVDTLAVFLTDSLICAGDTMDIQYYTPVKYNSNNVFTMQLSDSSGNFNTPINLGTKQSDTSGIISCVFPDTLKSSLHYRIRLLSSNTADTSYTFNVIIGNISTGTVVASSNSPICEGQSLQLSVSSSFVSTSYLWSGPSGFISNLDSPHISNATSTSSGDYIVALTLAGCTVYDTVSTLVNDSPQKPTVTNNGVLCAGDTLQLNATTTTTGVSYSWTGPNSFTDTAQNPTINSSTTAMSGVYTATVTKNNCSNSDTTNVLVKPSPSAVTLYNNSPLCDGDTLYLQSTSSTTGATYNWTGPNSYTSAMQTTSISNSTPAMSGWYKMMVDLNGCTVTDSTNVTINPIPSIPILTYSNPICVGDSLKLYATNVNATAYHWSGPNSFATTVQNPLVINVSFNDTGYYKIYTTANGCISEEDSIKVSINPSPFVVIMSNKDSVCDGDPVTFTALPANAGTNPQYQWYVNLQAVSGTNTTYTTSSLKHQDVIYCEMSDATKCSASFTDQSNDITISVLPWLAPSVSITANPNVPLKPFEYVTFTAQATDAGNPPLYQWKRNGADVLGAKAATWSANSLNDNDSISVEIESTYLCPQPKTASSNGIVVKVLTSVSDMERIKGVELYPNPNDGSFTLSGTIVSGEDVELTIINQVGQVIYKNNIKPINGQIKETIKLDNVASGVYLLRMTADGQQKNLRFVVK